ncbi:MAG: hypothetical protein H6945_08645 [Zoogloeaceae bacterium]|nr:hypothetical protein [Rhodocyclaceae bacterium]MCP5235790.1 hypothetical protein [Zoogloeaceae bacterium]
MSTITESDVKAIDDTLGQELQRAIEKAGLAGNQIERIELQPKADRNVMGFFPECKLFCMVGGFSPKVGRVVGSA